MTDLRHVSLFAGVGGADLGMHAAGIPTVAAVEIDNQARGVLAHRFPEAVLFKDVHDVTGDMLRDAGAYPDKTILSGGFPCQSFSVAGARRGTDDSRGTLFWQIIRIAQEFRPAWMVLENVPGLISIDNGNTLRDMLTELTDIGYLVDIDVLDAQFFGVPQRRRRVFFLCQRADLGLRRRTTTSALTTVTMLTQTLLFALDAHRQQSPTDAPSSAWSRSDCVDGLSQRMRLLSPPLDSDDLATLLATSADILQRSAHAPGDSASGFGDRAAGSTATGTSSSGSPPKDADSSATASRWKSISVALCDLARSSTTSTAPKTTTPSTISSFARVLLNTAALITHSTPSSPNYWHAASSASTALKGYTDYARSAGNSLLGDLDWTYDWDAFCLEADCLVVALGRLGDDRGPVQVLLEPEGSRRHPQARVTPGPGTSDAAAGGADRAGWSDGLVTSVAAKRAKGSSGPAGDEHHNLVVSVAGDQAGTLGTRSGGGRTTDIDSVGAYVVQPYVKAKRAQSDADDESWREGGVSPTLNDFDNGGESRATVLAVTSTVRRLTPVECERLMGWPDGHTAERIDFKAGKVVRQADSSRYRQCGNGMAAPVVQWIAERIVALEEGRL